MRTRHVLLVATAGLALATGCGFAGDDPEGLADEEDPWAQTPAEPFELGDPPPTEGPDPCSLLTEDEVADAVGTDVIEVLGPHDLTLHTECQWTFLRPGDNHPTAVNVDVWLGDAYYLPETGIDADRYEPVDGIGDEAAAWSGPDLPSGGQGCEVFFRTGQIVVQVFMPALVQERTCVDLARAAAGRV